MKAAVRCDIGSDRHLWGAGNPETHNTIVGTIAVAIGRGEGPTTSAAVVVSIAFGRHN